MKKNIKDIKEIAFGFTYFLSLKIRTKGTVNKFPIKAESHALLVFKKNNFFDLTIGYFNQIYLFLYYLVYY